MPRLLSFRDTDGDLFYVKPEIVTCLRVDENGVVLLTLGDSDFDYQLDGEIEEIAAAINDAE